MNANIVPIFSVEENDFKEYRNALVNFYETGNNSLYINYFLNKKIEYLQLFSDKKLINNNGLKL